MKKEQKIIELRRAAKLKVSELKTEIAVARSEAAEKRANLMIDRMNDLDGLGVSSTERFDVLAKYRAKLAVVDARLAYTVAQHKSEIQKIKAECEQQCAAAEDDPEPDKEQSQLNPQQETVYCDGSEHSARIVARRLINKMPHIPAGGSISVSIIRQDDGEFFVYASEIVKNTDKFIITTFSKEIHDEQYEAEFFRKAREKFKSYEDKVNSHVAVPMARALDAIFGGNPVDEVNNLISDTIKGGKDGSNE